MRFEASFEAILRLVCLSEERSLPTGCSRRSPAEAGAALTLAVRGASGGLGGASRPQTPRRPRTRPRGSPQPSRERLPTPARALGRCASKARSGVTVPERVSRRSSASLSERRTVTPGPGRRAGARSERASSASLSERRTVTPDSGRGAGARLGTSVEPRSTSLTRQRLFATAPARPPSSSTRSPRATTRTAHRPGPRSRSAGIDVSASGRSSAAARRRSPTGGCRRRRALPTQGCDARPAERASTA